MGDEVRAHCERWGNQGRGKKVFYRSDFVHRGIVIVKVKCPGKFEAVKILCVVNTNWIETARRWCVLVFFALLQKKKNCRCENDLRFHLIATTVRCRPHTVRIGYHSIILSLSQYPLHVTAVQSLFLFNLPPSGNISIIMCHETEYNNESTEGGCGFSYTCFRWQTHHFYCLFFSLKQSNKQYKTHLITCLCAEKEGKKELEKQVGKSLLWP